MHTQAVNRIGYWTAVFVFVFSIMFLAGAVAGLPESWDIYIPIGA